jgi:predicted RNA binding protein YcfA (HicA-like mRNA interferase family)
MTFRELEKILIKDGWYYHHANGSHYHYKHNIKYGEVIVPRHKGDIPKGTLNSILKQADLKNN